MCDRGSQWRGTVVQTMCSLTNTRVSMTAPYNPRCNSRIERPFRVVGSFLKTIANPDGSNWSDFVMPLQFAMNTSFNSATQKSPFEMVHLRKPSYPPDTVLPYPVPRDDSERFSHDLVRRLHETIKFARENEKQSERDMKARYDKGRKEMKYGPGELVILDTNTYKIGPRKLQTRFSPFLFEVVEQTSPVNVKLRHPHTGDTFIRNVAHVSPFKLRPSHLDMASVTHNNEHDVDMLNNSEQQQVNAEPSCDANSVPVADVTNVPPSNRSDSEVADFVSKVVNTRHTESGMEYLVQFGSALGDHMWLAQEDLPRSARAFSEIA